MPCIHENALLLVDGLDNGRAEDAAGLADGDEQVKQPRAGRALLRSRDMLAKTFGDSRGAPRGHRRCCRKVIAADVLAAVLPLTIGKQTPSRCIKLD